MIMSSIKQLKKEVAPFEKNDSNKSIMQLITTILPLIILWFAAYWSLSVSYWLTIPITIVAGLFVIRTFIIFHDCCHGSFFKNRQLNNIIGTITGVITLTPYMQWKQSHSIHHATSSNLDKRGTGDIWTLTVKEYAEAPWYTRLSYRLYRNPFVLFGIGPIAVFLIQQRFNRRGAKRAERLNTYLINILIVALYTGLCLLVGWKAFVMIQLPIFYIATMLGIWLFYVQHTFEDSYFEKEDEWSYVQAAVEGSSYYQLPLVLQWFTGNIGFHHVHHLSPRVPNYYLEDAHNATPPLQKATTITLKTSFKSIRFRLWDEEGKKFVSFRQFKQQERQNQRLTNESKPSAAVQMDLK
ncbi:fatty acid desaturase [Paenibacillus dauci]|uniref:fatty acid desaturase n=1 Tax=Paenibacillus dauci TaxID=1567106 RepID=UPI00061A07CE|nr:fatty acid desaturase [Paenibacillus dauci]